jgi:hypothetical protein
MIVTDVCAWRQRVPASGATEAGHPTGDQRHAQRQMHEVVHRTKREQRRREDAAPPRDRLPQIDEAEPEVEGRPPAPARRRPSVRPSVPKTMWNRSYGTA